MRLTMGESFLPLDKFRGILPIGICNNQSIRIKRMKVEMKNTMRNRRTLLRQNKCDKKILKEATVADLLKSG